MSGPGDNKTYDANGVMASVYDPALRALRISGSGASGAPVNASYVTMVPESGLSNETVLGTGVIMAGVLGSRPAAATAGRLYWASDNGIIYRDTGSTWVAITGATSESVIIDPASSTRNLIQSTADATELTLKAFAGQAADVLDVKDSSGATTLAISPTGIVDITATSNAAGQGPIVDITGPAGYPETYLRINNPDFGAPMLEIEETGRATFVIGATELATPSDPIWSVNFGPGIPLQLMQLFAPTSEGGTKGILWEIDSFDAGDITFVLAARGDQTSDVWQVQGPNGVSYGRVVGFRPNGQIISNAHALPADGDLNNSDFALWLDDTPGATCLKIKAKDSGGTVRTATVPLT